MITFSPGIELARLRNLCDVIDDVIERHGTILDRVAPAVSAWSAEHQIAHIALANELVLRNLRSLARGSGALVVANAEQRPQVIAMLAAGTFQRGQAQSPRMVRPPETIDRDLMLQWLADGRREIELLLENPALLDVQHLFVPHQILGPLNAPQWARFAAAHTNHHLTIAYEVLRASAVRDLDLRTLPSFPSLSAT